MTTQIGGRDIKLSLDTRHNTGLAVTGKPRAKVIFCDFNLQVSVESPPPLEDETSPIPMSSLSSSSGSYTASAGDSHTANFTAPSAYSSVEWYVKSPTDTSTKGTKVETDTGDGSSTTASLEYTFAADAVAGVYVITASVYPSSGDAYEVSYTVTIPTIPETPSIGSVILEGDTQIRLTWSAPASDGESAITDYEYRYQLSGATLKGAWSSAGTSFSKTVSSLTAGASYTIEMRAKNGVGYSVASAPFSFTVPAIISGFSPAAGSSYTATAGDTHTGEVRHSSLFGAWLYVNGKKIKWVEGGATATRLLLSWTFPEDASGSWTIGAHVITREDNTYSYHGYYSYTVEVSAPQTVPGVPLSLSATAGNGSVELSWQPPVSDGNSPILRYEYRYGIGESVTVENYTDWASMGSAMATYPVSPLTNDMYHIFEVRAVNAIGNSAPSAPASTTPTAPPPPTPTPPPPTASPGQPTGLSVDSTSNGTVTVSWTAPENDGGGIDDYEYRIDANNDGSWGAWESLDSSNTSATLNLQNGRNYGIQVRAKNSVGSSTQSTKVTAMPVDSSVSVPSAPRNLQATAEDGQVRLSWNTPSTGTGIIDYEYRLDTNDDGSWRPWKITDSTSTSDTVPGLTNETLYAFLVRARNAGSAGTQSEKVTATPTNITVPTKPRNLTASLTTDGRIYHLRCQDPDALARGCRHRKKCLTVSCRFGILNLKLHRHLCRFCNFYGRTCRKSRLWSPNKT